MLTDNADYAVASRESQYLDKLAFLVENARAFPVDDYDMPVADWSPAMKTRLTQTYNKARLALATSDIALKPTTRDYQEMVRLIRPFAKGFTGREGYALNKLEKLTPAKKGKLTKYFRALIVLGSRPFEMYKSKNTQKMRIAADMAGQPTKGLPGLRGILVPVQSLGEKTKIAVDVKRSRVIIDTPTHRIVALSWDELGITFEELALDPEGVVEYAVELLGMKRYSINAGEYSIGKGVPILWTPGRLKTKVKELVEKYGSENYDPNDSNSHHFRNWLTGIRGYDFDTMRTEQAWSRAYLNESMQRKRYKRLLRKRLKYGRQTRGKRT